MGPSSCQIRENDGLHKLGLSILSGYLARAVHLVRISGYELGQPGGRENRNLLVFELPMTSNRCGGSVTDIQGWEFALSLLALSLKISHFKERP